MNVRSVPVVGAVSRQDAAPWIERFARVGFVAKGVLYLTVGLLAASAGLGRGGNTNADSHRAMGTILTAPFGRVLLAVVAIGLVGYSVWRIVEGITDPERRGSDAKGIALRASFIARGIIHLALAGTAASLAVYQSSGSRGGGASAKNWTGRVLDVPGGVYLLWGAAAGFVGYGIYQLSCAWRSKLSKKLELGRVSGDLRRWIIGVSRFGIAARGIVFGTIGVLLARAANQHDAKEAGGVGDSMRELGGLGQWPFVAIALGFAAYGVYQLINARYRRIQVK